MDSPYELIHIINYNGGPSRTRNRVIGYEPTAVIKQILWWAFTDSNRGPIGYEPTALTN